MHQGSSSQPMQQPITEIWLRFPTMEELAKQASTQPIDQSCPRTNEKAGLSAEEALELASAKVAFPRIKQQVWPNTRSSNPPDNQFHLTQLPFDVQIDSATNFARIYHIMLHFEKLIKDYFSSEIIEMTSARFQKMGILLGDILEPIVPLCNARDPKAWNGMTKIHLKNPATDGIMLLTGARIFTLTLDGEQRVAKICKSYANTGYNEQMTVTITGDVLKDMGAHEIHNELIETNLRRGQDFEIIHVRKTLKDKIAYIIAASPKQKQKLLLHQVSVRQDLITPNLILQQTWTKEEIAKKNCLTFIIKNVNVAYSQSKVTEVLKKMMGENNVICTYFLRGNAVKDQHDGICNLEVINLIVYKQYVRKSPKLLHMYAKFTPHPQSLDDTSLPTT
jgi:hypothetical protein